MYCVSLFLGYVLPFFLLLFFSFFNLPVGRCMEFVECKRVRKWRKKGRGDKGQTLMVRDVADLLHGNNSSGTTSPSRYRFCTSEQQSRSMIRVYIEGRPNLLNLRAEYREIDVAMVIVVVNLDPVYRSHFFLAIRLKCTYLLLAHLIAYISGCSYSSFRCTHKYTRKYIRQQFDQQLTKIQTAKKSKIHGSNVK